MPTRSKKLILIFCSVFLAFYAYLGHQLFAYSGLSIREALPWMLFIFLMLGSIASLPLYFFTVPGAREGTTFQRLVPFIYFSMSYLSYLLLLNVARDLGSALSRLGSHPWFSYSLNEGLWILALSFLLPLLGAILAKAGPFLKEVEIRHPKISTNFDGYRIVQISDLHIGRTVGAASVRKVVKRVNDSDPDAIVLTGDIFDGYMRDIEASCQPLKDLRAPDGIFYVPGNHEYYFDFGAAMDKAAALGFRVLLNDFQTVDRSGGLLVVAGLPDRAAGALGQQPADPQGLRERIRASVPEKNFTLLLDHQPNGADVASQLGYDLQLSGHTHNGQFYPWVWVVKFVQKYSQGLYTIGDMKLYVNSGTMYWGPPIRLGSLSEITAITLRSAK